MFCCSALERQLFHVPQQTLQKDQSLEATLAALLLGGKQTRAVLMQVRTVKAHRAALYPVDRVKLNLQPVPVDGLPVLVLEVLADP